jgi:hypothetical protein
MKLAEELAIVKAKARGIIKRCFIVQGKKKKTDGG